MLTKDLKLGFTVPFIHSTVVCLAMRTAKLFDRVVICYGAKSSLFNHFAFL